MKKLLLSTLALSLGIGAQAQSHFSQSITSSVSFYSPGFGSVKLSSGNFITVEPNAYMGFTIRQFSPTGAHLITTQLSNSICDITSVTSVTNLDANSILVTGNGSNASMLNLYYVAKINLLTNNITISTKSSLGSYTNGPKAVTNGSDIFVSYPDYSAFSLSKFDSNLNPIWAKTCEADTTTGKNPGTDCGLIDDSTIVIIGKCDDELGWGDYDTSGTLDSFRLYHAAGYTRVYAINPMADGNVLISGLHSHTYAGISSPFIAKLTKSGTVVWARTLNDATPGVTFSSFADAIELPNGNIAAFASSASLTTADGVTLFDANGNYLLSKKFGTSTLSYALFDFKAYNDGILMTGNVTNTSNGTIENLMIFSDFNFNIVCDKMDVSLVPSIFNMGTTTSVGTAGVREMDVALPTTANFGTVTLGSGTGVNVCAFATGINEEISIESSVYPNPVEAGANVNLSFSEAGSYDIQVIDFSGKLISTSHVNGSLAIVNTNGFASGNYLVRVSSNGTLVATEKVLVK